MAPKPGWWIYKGQMDSLCHGDALWQPSPVSYIRIAIGDVGFIRRGRFHLLLSAGSPLGERQLGEDVPTTFEELTVGTPIRDPPRLPGCLCTTTVRGMGAGLGATVPTTPPLEPGANFSFELTGNHGAALVTKYSTYKEDTLLDSAFERYTKRHYDSWVAFARNKDYGNEVQPVLISGVDLTRDFAMAAYSYEDTSLEANLNVTAPMFISASASLWGTWRTRYAPHTNYGPQECTPTSLEQAVDISSLQLTDGGTTPSAFNQCVFVRYYTLRSRGPLRLFPKVTRAGAGPHDLGPGDNTGDTFSALAAQSDTETTDDIGVERDIVVRNTPNDNEYDSWSAVADYVFQNSNAVSVLIHHRDLAGIRTVGDTDDISSLFARHRPDIVVDESGVGRVHCEKLWQQGMLAKRPTLEDIPMPPTSLLSLIRLRSLDESSLGFQDQLSDVLNGEEYTKWVPNLQGYDLVWLIDYLDKVLDILRPKSTVFQRCLHELRSICGTRVIAPSSYFISPQLLDIGEIPVAVGSTSDLFEGILDGSKVRVKRFRIHLKNDPTGVARIPYQAAVVWRRLKHQNVDSLLGVTSAPLQFISGWAPGGNLIEYIDKNPGADRVGLLSDVAEGLQFLHSCNVVHGNLKGHNVLIGPNDRARVTDIGLAPITQNLDFIRSSPDDQGYTVRWTAPELLNRQGTCSPEVDIFSFAMVMVEAFTGAVPFNGSSPIAVMLAIQQGNRPPRPEHPTFTEELWMLMQRCWDQKPNLRPRVSKVLQSLLNHTPPAWKRLIKDSRSMQERIYLATYIFSTPNEAALALQLNGDDAQNFIDAVDGVLENLGPQIRQQSLRCLYNICGRQAIVPRSLVIPFCYDSTDVALCGGGFADIWKGRYQDREVAAKVSRVYLNDDPARARRRFCREVMMRKGLHHPNLLPLLGVTMVGTKLVMVSEWMVNGSIDKFVELHPNADRLELLSDAAKGLSFLHDQELVHGDLKGANILVDHHGRACLADFTLLIAEQRIDTSSAGAGGTVRWMSPELLDPKAFGLADGRPTRGSDCYAFGMSFLKWCVENVQRNLKEYEGNGSQLRYGLRWNFVGSPDRPTGQVRGIYFRSLKDLNLH